VEEKMKKQIENERVPVGLGVFIVIFNRNFSKILLLKRNEEKIIRWGADWWNIGGSIESREHSLDAGIREAREEAGLELEKNKVKLVEVKEMPNFSETYHGIHFAYATTIDESAPIKINSESDGHGWFSVDNLPDRMLDKPEFIKEIRDKAIEIFEK
jgi:ADP-ribose pyrophosphatase YjhB (NUDIX family)